MSKVKIIYSAIKEGISGLIMSFFCRKDRFGYFASSSTIRTPVWGPKQNVFIYDNCGINGFVKFIGHSGKFIMKRNCSVGPGLTVIMANHTYDKVGIRPETERWSKFTPDEVVVNEDVWIGANVTLCPGTVIGRGCIIAAGSVCIKKQIYPPYSIVGGNPAKFIKFRLSIDDQIKQEKLLYAEADKIPIEKLKEHYLRFQSKK